MPSPHTSSSTTNVSQSSSLGINALLSGSKWAGGTGTWLTLTYSFPWSQGNAVFSGLDGAKYSTLNEPSAAENFALTTTEQTAARSALQTWSNVVNIKFTEVADTSTNVGDIRFAWTSATDTVGTGGKAWGWAYEPDNAFPSGGDIWISTLGHVTNSSWTAGSYNFSSLLHELGHALGLKHPFEGTPILSASQNSMQYSVMSYTDHPHSLFVKVTRSANGTYSWSSSNVQPDAPMLYDVLAMQYIYGTNITYKTGNDTYTFDPSTPFFRTILDAGGSDTISVFNFSKGSTIDLRQGHFSKITVESNSTAGVNWGSSPPPVATYDGTDNLAIAYGSVIENAIGGSGNDTLIGNAENNTLQGNGGNDTINGGAGNDTLFGGAGIQCVAGDDDTLDGGAGIDTALFSFRRQDYQITKTTIGYTVSEQGIGYAAVCGGSSGGGTDTLTNVERLKFSDFSVALDVSGNAGTTAKILGAVFGKESVTNKEYVGIGLSLLDGGMSYLDLMQLAINAALGAGASNATVVKLLYTNVVGTLPPAGDLAYFTGWLDSGAYTRASFGVLAADTELNTVRINLAGLATSGLEYLPYLPLG